MEYQLGFNRENRVGNDPGCPLDGFPRLTFAHLRSPCKLPTLRTFIQSEQLSVTTNRSSINRQYLLISETQQVMRSASLGTGA